MLCPAPKRNDFAATAAAVRHSYCIAVVRAKTPSWGGGCRGRRNRSVPPGNVPPALPPREDKATVDTAVRILIALVIAVFSLLPSASAATAEPTATSGQLFTETGPHPGEGYRIADDAGIPFWSEFQRLGGVSALGYPISRRFTLDGFVSQATQRAILQWRPNQGRVALVNILDRLHDAGLDDLLAASYATPRPLPEGFDTGKSPSQVVLDRLALLDVDPALRAAYFAVPNPLERFGLPTSRVTDMGNHFAVRLQRTVLQHWKIDVPWARAGTVTPANAGDLARLAGLIPAAALVPEPAGAEAAPSAAAALDAIRQATVQVISSPAGQGTGFILRADGFIVTANHVVAGASGYTVVLPDGRRVSAELVGRDVLLDVAVLKVAAGNLAVASLGDSATLVPGDTVVALGHGAPRPAVLQTAQGKVIALSAGDGPGGTHRPGDFILSDVPLAPGFSGGPLVDTGGRVVGMNTAVISAGRGPNRTQQSLSVAVNAILPVATQIVAEGTVRPVSLGVTAADLTLDMARGYNLPVEGGALVVDVESGSPAAAADLQAGDVITGIAGVPVAGAADLGAAMDRHVPGDSLALDVLANDGERRTASVVLAAAT